MDYESWHCKFEPLADLPLFCPPEGCSKGKCLREIVEIDKIANIVKGESSDA